MKPKRKGRRDRGPRIVDVVTAAEVRLVHACPKGSQCLLDVSPPMERPADPPVRVTRHAKDGQVVLSVSQPFERPIMDGDEIVRDRQGNAKVEMVVAREVWRLPNA